MKARVQYNDYRGTSAGDRSDYLESHGGQVTEIIVNTFQIPVEADDYEYVGVSVYGTEVEDVCATFFLGIKRRRKW